jgi:hypothetical protein
MGLVVPKFGCSEPSEELKRMRAGLRAKVSIGALVLGLALAVALPTSAQQSADQVVLDLNHGAMEAYNNMDINKAGSMLEEALRVATEAGVMGPLLAQTNMNLAIVYVGGLGDNDSGVRYFADALCADPSSQLDPLTSTPDIQSVFQVAAQRVQQAGCGAPPGRPNVGPRAAAQTMPMGPGAGGGYQSGGDADHELPPGWGTTKEDDGGGKAKDFKRGFVQLGFALGMPYVSNGMLADRPPPTDRIFIHSMNGGRIANPAEVAASTPNVLRFPGTRIGVNNPATGQDVGLEAANAWVPDADSSDGYTNEGMGTNYIPLQGACPADGIDTGPPVSPAPMDARPLFPSRYCVRVKSPGFAPQAAMRANFGYFLTRDLSIALITRFQFSAGQGTFAHMLLGGRLEYMFTKTKARGLMVSGFLGGTFGQIQAQPSAAKSTGQEPWIKSGLQGAHVGTNIRFRFTDNIGMFMAPEFDLQFPTLLWNIDLTVLGAEFAF